MPVSRRICILCSTLTLVFFLSGCGATVPNVTNSVTETATAASPQKETLVWSDEFTSSGGQTKPTPANWSYRTAAAQPTELAKYCGPQSASPCDPNNPNSFLDGSGFLHIQARKAASGAYTSAMLWTQNLNSFQYGRFEARMKLPNTPGFWPAFWMLGSDSQKVQWPACGEIDILETFSKGPNVAWGTIHGQGFANGVTKKYTFPSTADTATAFHTYGILWSPQKISYYIDSPSNIYGTVTPESIPEGAIWPFDSQQFYIVLNLSVWAPATTSQEELVVDYVRVWKES